MTEQADLWCILRTSGGKTLPLARSLVAAGFEAWTPQMTIDRRRPRSKATQQLEAPILPTFVFVRADRLAELARTLLMPINPHPAFSIFRYAGRVPLVGDQDVRALHGIEDQAREKRLIAARKAQAKAMPVGTAVRVKDGPALGMSGVVVGGDKKAAKIDFGGRYEMTIVTWRLDPLPVCAGASPETGIAA